MEPVAKKAKTAEEDKKGKEKEEAAEDLPLPPTPNSLRLIAPDTCMF